MVRRERGDTALSAVLWKLALRPRTAGGDIIRELFHIFTCFFSFISSHFKQSSENSYEYYTEYVIMSSILYTSADISWQQREIRCSVVKEEFFNSLNSPQLDSRAFAIVSLHFGYRFFGEMSGVVFGTIFELKSALFANTKSLKALAESFLDVINLKIFC